METVNRNGKILLLQLAKNQRNSWEFSFNSSTSSMELNTTMSSINSNLSKGNAGYLEVDPKLLLSSEINPMASLNTAEGGFCSKSIKETAVLSGVVPTVENLNICSERSSEHTTKNVNAVTNSQVQVAVHEDSFGEIYDPDYQTETDISMDDENTSYETCSKRSYTFYPVKSMESTNKMKDLEEKCTSSQENLVFSNKVIGSNKKLSLEPEKIDINYETLDVNTSEKSKKHFCFYCGKLQSKFARHLEIKHPKEKDVAEFIFLPKRDRNRLKLITELRNKSDFLYNSQSIFNKGNIIVVRRPNAKKGISASNYRPCGHCGGMYSKFSLAVHYRRCKITIKGKKDVLASSRLRGYVNPKANAIMRNKVLPYMRQDHINYLIRTQSTIIMFGNRLTYKYRSPHLFKMIRARLRYVARFFDHFREYRPNITNLEEVFDPAMYDDAIKAINSMARLNENTGKYEAPATASTIASLLKKISLHLVAEMIKLKNKPKLDNVRDFLQLLQEGLSYDIFKTVTENQLELKRKKTVELPSSQDIERLRVYLDKHILAYTEKLVKKFMFDDWKELSSLLLISLQLFNRRRAGEIARIKIKDFKRYESIDANLSTNGDSFKKYIRFLIRGKKARGVPVMVHNKELKSLKLILKFRNKAKVPSSNPYLFGIPGRDENQHLEADRLMRRYSSICGAQNPRSLRGTELRKHLATNCALWNLGEVQIKDVADYMGHHEKIHLDHYRLPCATRDITRISNILERAQRENTPDGNNITLPSEDEFNLFGEGDLNEASYEETLMHAVGAENDHILQPTNIPVKCNMKKRLSWSIDEKQIITMEAKFYLDNFEPVPMEFCDELLQKYSLLKKRSRTSLKGYIMNEIKRRKDKIICEGSKKGPREYWNEEEKAVVNKCFRNNIETKKLPSLPFCKEVIEQNKVLCRRTPSMLKAYLNNLLKTMK